jgi:hypothetical protein
MDGSLINSDLLVKFIAFLWSFSSLSSLLLNFYFYPDVNNSPRITLKVYFFYIFIGHYLFCLCYVFFSTDLVDMTGWVLCQCL